MDYLMKAKLGLTCIVSPFSFLFFYFLCVFGFGWGALISTVLDVGMAEPSR